MAIAGGPCTIMTPLASAAARSLPLLAVPGAMVSLPLPEAPDCHASETNMTGQRMASCRSELRPAAARALTMRGVPAQQSAAVIAPITLQHRSGGPKAGSDRPTLPRGGGSGGVTHRPSRGVLQRLGGQHSVLPLDRRAWNRPVGAEDAAVAGFGRNSVWHPVHT